MAKERLAWKDTCVIREEILSKKQFTLAEFAADLNGVRMNDENTPIIYRDPSAFFSRTYPTPTLKKLVRDVFLRLAGEGGVPVHHIQVTYGGGKTHTLITLLHLAEKGLDLTSNPVVKEFLNYLGLSAFPKARVAILPLDKFDVFHGLEVVGPSGSKRRINTMWGAIAYQLGGDEGFLKIKEHDDSFTPPSESVLADLLKMPSRDGLSTLILIDEIIIYYRTLINKYPKRMGTLKDFFQCLTQAVARTERCAIVASLISSDVEKNDTTGLEILDVLTSIFQRIGEVQEPVKKEDISELLRRRLFESLPEPKRRQEIIDKVFSRIQATPDLRKSQTDQTSYDRYLRDYPFHPALIDIFYTKWTQLASFQRTRGALRLFALTLREAIKFDNSPLIGPAAFLASAGGISDVLAELVNICEEKDRWPQILKGEIDRCKSVSESYPSLKSREIEQVVVAVFLHSQPKGQKAETADLLEMIVHPGIDLTAFNDALQRWRDLSWFLKDIPSYWMLVTSPNMTSLHLRSINRVKPEEIDGELSKRIRDIKNLKKTDEDVVLHLLPKSNTDINDSAELHYVILNQEYAVDLEAGIVPDLFKDLFNRVYKNSIVALVPEKNQLNRIKGMIREYLAWISIGTGDDFDLLEEFQKTELKRRCDQANKNIAEGIVNLYEILVTLGESGEILSIKLPYSSTTPFEKIKKALVEQDRMLVTTLDLALLLPGSHYEIWGKEERRKSVRDLVFSFGQYTRLPKVLNSTTIFDTLENAVTSGSLVLEITRPDKTKQQFWKSRPKMQDLNKKEAEIVPLDVAELESFDSNMLLPGKLEGFWAADGNEPEKIEHFLAFFDGKRAPRLKTPKILDDAIQKSVENGSLMLVVNNAGFCKETLPGGIVDIPKDATLLLPLKKVVGSELLQENLPEAWKNDAATLNAVWDALTKKAGLKLPWYYLRNAINDALNSRYVEISGGIWPCSREEADKISLIIPRKKVPGTQKQGEMPGQDEVSTHAFNWEPVIDDFITTKWSKEPTALKSILESIKKGHTSEELPVKQFIATFNRLIGKRAIELQSGSTSLRNEPASLEEIIVLPRSGLRSDISLTLKEIQDVPAILTELLEKAPELDFHFHLVIDAEGKGITEETIRSLNEILQKIKADIKFVKSGDR